MNTKLLLNLLGRAVHSFIYTVGCVSIWTYTIEKWAGATHVLVGVALLVLLLRYLWRGEARDI